MGIVLQQNFLFTGTIMENIRVGQPDATDERSHRGGPAARLPRPARSRCRKGLHTQVGERGASLSLGQRQLVCFARAMLADPRILILDEATSSVDTLTELRIQRALAKLLTGRTSFVVAHRLSTIRSADQILVLEDGRIVERGTHAELLAARRRIRPPRRAVLARHRGVSFRFSLPSGAELTLLRLQQCQAAASSPASSPAP